MKTSVEDFKAIEKARYDANLRTFMRRSFNATDYQHDPKKSKVSLVSPGVLGIFIAAKNSKAEKILSKIENGDCGQTDDLSKLILTEMLPLTKSPVPDVVDEMLSKPCYCEIRNAGKALASNIFLPQGVSCVALALPYTGGDLLKEGLEIIEYTRSEFDEGFSIFAFKRPPDDLSEEEDAALKMLTKDQLSLNVGQPDGFAGMLIALAAGVCLATGICCIGSTADDIFNDGVSDPPPWIDEPERLSVLMGAGDTVAKLLHRRTIALRL